MSFLGVLFAIFAAFAAVRAAVAALRPAAPRRARTVVVLGSGGHTAEMLRLLRTLDFDRYSPRTYVVAETDAMSASKAQAFELQRSGAGTDAGAASAGGSGAVSSSSAREGGVVSSYRVVRIPRSREVGQSFVTSVFTTLWALAFSAWVALSTRPDVVLTNGPGTCLPIVVATKALWLLGLCRGRVVYVESIARVYRLSLTGKIFYKLRLADAFFVQWPELLGAFPRARHVGRLM